MSIGPKTTVALINPLWFGHHPMYLSQFTGAFLRLGADVVGLCPEPEEALRDARTALGATIPDLDERISMHHLPVGITRRGRFGSDPLRTWQRWRMAARRLRETEVSTDRKVDFVFFPLLDHYLLFLPFSKVPSLTIHRPWSGLYLRNHHHLRPSFPVLLGKGDRLIRNRLCPAVGVLDERTAEPLESYLQKPVLPFPDVTDASLPERPHPLASEILAKAKGRKIIGLIGLEQRKGLLNLMRLAGLARERKLPWYFVCSGGFDAAEFRDEDRRRLEATSRQVASGEIDNLYFNNTSTRIPAEADYNSVFTTFDVAWVAYEGFMGSSGAIGKAAAFDIPSIATAGECIGGRVEHYGIGLTIPEGDTRRALEAVTRILERRDWNDGVLREDYAAYRHDHGHARLDEALASILNRI